MFMTTDTMSEMGMGCHPGMETVKTFKAVEENPWLPHPRASVGPVQNHTLVTHDTPQAPPQPPSQTLRLMLFARGPYSTSVISL